MAAELGHLDDEGRLRMVDVGAKATTRRVAVAACRVRLQPQTLEAVMGAGTAKGDVLSVAQVAGVQAAKRTPELIPGCHPVRLSAVQVSFAAVDGELEVRAEVRGDDRTGFEMEALTACAVAALTVYDMTKGIDPEAVIGELRVERKEGGKSSRPVTLDGVRAAVVTVSDSTAAGEREDLSGPAVAAWLEGAGAEVADRSVVADDRDAIADRLRHLSGTVDLVVTTGGTGVGPRDVTPEATADVAERLVPGLAEVMRSESLRVTPHAMLARGIAALVGPTLVLNLPGSPKAATENLDAVGPALAHAVDLVRGNRPH